MCNQLLSLAGLYSLGLEYDCDIECPVVDEQWKKYFAFESKTNSICVDFYYSKIKDLYMRFLKIVMGIFKINIDRKIDSKKNRKQIFYSWISFLDNESFVHHVDDIREFFRFNSQIEVRCKKKLDGYKAGDEIFVGVHIRRGDYKEFLNGKYYYDDYKYITWMKNLQDNSKQKMCFVLCSNEKLQIEEYEKAQLKVIVPGTSGIEDLCYLSLCDYVMGPPSTFSFWAAMYGNKPRCILDHEEKNYSWFDFDFFENRLKNGDYIR